MLKYKIWLIIAFLIVLSGICTVIFSNGLFASYYRGSGVQNISHFSSNNSDQVSSFSGLEDPILTRVYSWEYGGKIWNIAVHIPKSLYNFYRSRPRHDQGEYEKNVFSEQDRQYLKKIIEYIQETWQEEGYCEYDAILTVISLVQSLPYTSDLETTGYDDYPRYPIETLVDSGGDCEDTAILAAALLNEMGYGTALIIFPTHVGVGVEGPENFPGTYYQYNGIRYYYLETTRSGYRIGILPEKFENQSATIVPLIRSPHIVMTISHGQLIRTSNETTLDVTCMIQNDGTDVARNISLDVAALSLSQGNGFIYTPVVTRKLDHISENSSAIISNMTLQVPHGEQSKVRGIVTGNNFAPVTSYSDLFVT